ncbi:MAG TPA: class I SAM-dependent methyltransferase [Rhodocyclaceae bacterium]|nr:class I SAM-dependent methyltransferase [Rhodocyclaceae bacterium]
MRAMSDSTSSPLRDALLAQIAGALMAFSLVWLSRSFVQWPLFPVALLQGLCAALVSWRLGAPRWWWLINFAFLPLAVLALALNIAPGWYLLAFLLTLLVFWRTDKSRVPLYLSNADTAAAVAALLPAQACRVIDLGCGDGRLLRRLASARPDCSYTGIEYAPLTWLLAKCLNLRHTNVAIRYGDFWQEDLGHYDVVYAFLSPAPMPALANKAQAEMEAGKLLISNSFPIPDRETAQTIALTDRRQTRLFCYKIG